MSFEKLPDLPEGMFPETRNYISRNVALALQAHEVVRSVCDVPYGESYWHKVDFHLPDDESLTGLPVMCNIHGGGWRNGCKEWQAMLAPSVTLTPAIFASVDYRLAPEVKIEAIVDDCCDALALVYNTVEQYGGDPDRIFLSGHSAGGHLSSYLALRPDLLVERGLPANVIKACMPSSGIYVFDFDQLVGAADFTTSAFNTSWMDIAYRQLFEDIEDRSVAAAYSSVNHVKGNTIPFHVSWGETDIPEVIRTTEMIVQALKNENCVLETYMWDYLDHFDCAITQAHESGAWIAKMREWMAELPKV